MSSCGEAAKAFESVFRCHVCFHDYDGRVLACAGPFPLSHRNSFCEHFKKPRKAFALCCQMEAELSREKLQSERKPFFKCCHAGAMELAFPIFFKGSLTGALFIGPFKGVAEAPGASKTLSQKRSLGIPEQAVEAWEALPKLNAQESSNLIAFAELFAAKIEKSFEMELELGAEAPYGKRAKHFIDLNFRREIYLKDLAKTLGVGEARCCQILKAQFGAGFSTLLAERRMEHAKYLLKESLLKMAGVAAECGFSDVAYFHRVFKERTGETPREFRLKTQSEAVSRGSLQA